MRDRLVSSLPDIVEEPNPESVTNPEFVPDAKLQVNRFVGYGLFKLIERVNSQVNRDAREDDDDFREIHRDRKGMIHTAKISNSLEINLYRRCRCR